MKYNVHFTTVASSMVTVEADDPEEAIDKAYGEVYVSICHQCNGKVEIGDEWEPECVTDEAGEEVWTKRKPRKARP